MSKQHKMQRLYTQEPLSSSTLINLSDNQTHYLKNVMRLSLGDKIRLFNAENGEWVCEITELKKKSTSLKTLEQTRTPLKEKTELHLLFAPIKKQRLDFLIEKAIELGATHLHPVITEHTENRKLKNERIQAQIIEATEQSERLSLAVIEKTVSLKEKIEAWNYNFPILWAAERQNANKIGINKRPCAFLVGPEGGFSETEIQYLSQHKNIKSISLGENILRAETAALYCLSHTE